jgi:uncharacterized membrane-anchored protein
MTRRTQIALLAAALVAVPAGYAAWNELALHRGTHVVLRARPVDPHDPFRGEYVALSYPESRLPHGAHEGETWYVPLRRRADGVWVGRPATRVRPDGGVFLRGHAGEWQLELDGLGRFYVREGRARDYERALFSDRLYADAVVDSDGGAHLTRLEVR